MNEEAQGKVIQGPCKENSGELRTQRLIRFDQQRQTLVFSLHLKGTQRINLRSFNPFPV
jgi:hypothetical protein